MAGFEGGALPRFNVALNFMVHNVEGMQAARQELISMQKELKATSDKARYAARVLKEAKSKGGATFGSPGATSQLKKGSAELKKWKHEVEQVNIAVKAQPKNLKHALNNIKTINQAMKQQRNIGIVTADQYKRMGTGMQTYASRAVNSLERIKVKVHVLRNSLLGLSNAWTAQAKQMQWIGRQMIVGISLPLALFAQKAISAFRDVEVAQVRFRKVSDVTAEEFEDVWVEKLRNISREFAQTESITTELAADWAAFGLEGQQLEQLTAITSQFALLGDIDLAEATPYVRSVFATFGEHDVEATTAILEKFNAIENDTALQTKDLADALPQVAPVAKQFGMSAEEVAASLAAMVEVGLDATESAHGLKFGLQRLLAPTQQAKDGIAELFGMSFEQWAFDAQGNARAIPQLMTEIGQAMELAPDVLEADFMSDVFGKRQVSRMTALTTDLADAAAEGGVSVESAFDTAMAAAETDASGVAQKELDAIQQSADFAIKQMKNELKMFMTDFGAELIDPFMKLMKVLIKLGKAFSGLNDGVKTMIVGTLAFAAALGPILYVLAQAKLAFATTLGAAARMFPPLGAMTKDAVGAMHDLGRKILAVGDTVYDMGRHWGTAHLPDKVDAVTSGLGKMGDAATRTAAEVAGIETSIEGANAAWQSGYRNITAPVGARVGGHGTLQRGPADGVFKAGERTPDMDIIPIPGRKASKAGEEVAEAASQGFFRRWVTKFKESKLLKPFYAVGKKIKDIFANAPQEMNKSKSMAGTIAKIFPKAGKITQFATRFLKVGAVLAAIGAIITAIIASFKGLSKNWDAIHAKMEPGLTAVHDAWDEIYAALMEVGRAFQPIWDAFSGLDDSLSRDGGETRSFWAGIGSAVGWVAEQLAWFMRGLATAIEWAAPVIQKFAEFVGWAFDMIGGWASRIVAFIGALMEGDWSDAWKLGINLLYNIFINPLMQGAEVIIDTMSWAVTGVINLMEALSDAANDVPILGRFAPEFDAEGARQAVEDFRASSFADDFQRDIDDWSGYSTGEGRRYGLQAWEDFQDEIDEPVDGPPIAGPDGGDYEEEGEDAANDWRKGWYSAVKSSLDEIIGEVLDAAKKAMDKQFEKNLEVFDNRIEAIEEVEKAEKRLFQTQKYLSARKEMLRKRDISLENYARNRSLAIYEGRIDDARMLDLENERDAYDHNKSLIDLDEDRRKELLDIQREDQKEKINMQKDHEKEKQDILRESFEKQLDIIAEYTPRTIGEMQNMLNAITGELWQAGVNWWPYIGATGMNLYREAIADANEDIIQDAAWSGDHAATAWLDAFVSGEAQAILSRTSGGSGAGAGAGAALTNTPLPQDAVRTGRSYGLGGFRNSAGNLQGFSYHTGGGVGPSGAPKDIPATLQSGEFVMRRSSVNKIGGDVMARINKTGQLPMGGPGGVNTSPFVNAVSSGLGNLIGKDGWIGSLTESWQQNEGTIGGMSMAAVNYVFDALGGMVGGKRKEDLFTSIIPGDFTIIEQFANWVGSMFGLRLSSAHRTEAENRAVGGSPTSGHLQWDTVDIAGSWENMMRAWQWLVENMAQLPIKQAIFANSQIRGSSVMPWGGGGHMDHIHIQLMENWQDIVNTAYGAPGATGGALKDQVRNYANSMYGWSGAEWLALHTLIQKESSWIPTNQNRSSGAYGLFQFMPFHWGPGHYLPSGTNASVQEQMAGGLRYIKNTYGSPTNALAFHRRNNWYHEGGPVAMMAGGKVPYDNYPAMLHRGETVLPQPIAEGWERGLDGDTMGTTVNIYADSFVGDFEYFKKNMEKYDVEVKPRKAMAAGTNVRRISSRAQVNR